jgi:hypothetical protein
MKLSNKILLGFFGFIFLYLTAAFAEIRMRGVPNIINTSNSITETVSIPGVTYLKISDVDKEVNVIGSDRAELEVLSFSGNLLKKLTYKISGDTLTLSGLQSEDIETMKISVFLPKAGLRGITIDHSSASVRGLQPELLNIVQRSGRIWMTDNGIAKMNIDLSHSSLEISNSNVDSLSARAERSQVNIYSPVGVVQGSITDGTQFHITGLEEIQLKKDKSSVLMINQ